MWCYVCVCGPCVWDILIVECGTGKWVKIREVPEMSEGWRGRGWAGMDVRVREWWGCCGTGQNAAKWYKGWMWEDT
jgi:hypothetical protein